MAAQQSTRAIEAGIYHPRQVPRCRLCKETSETIQHITAECILLAGSSIAVTSRSSWHSLQEHLYHVRTGNSEVKVGHTQKVANQLDIVVEGKGTRYL